MRLAILDAQLEILCQELMDQIERAHPDYDEMMAKALFSALYSNPQKVVSAQCSTREWLESLVADC